MSEEDYSQNISKFDSTIAVLMRLDQLWKDCHRHSRQGKLMQWNFDLDRVWIELTADANPDQKKKFKEMNNNISKEKNQANLYSFIMAKEEFLKDLEKMQGKGVGYQESVEDYIQK